MLWSLASRPSSSPDSILSVSDLFGRVTCKTTVEFRLSGYGPSLAVQQLEPSRSTYSSSKSVAEDACLPLGNEQTSIAATRKQTKVLRFLSVEEAMFSRLAILAVGAGLLFGVDLASIGAAVESMSKELQLDETD